MDCPKFLGSNEQLSRWTSLGFLCAQGEDWGVGLDGEGSSGGFVYLQYGENTCGVSQEAYAATGTAPSTRTLSPQAYQSTGGFGATDSSSSERPDSVWNDKFTGAVVGSVIGVVALAGITTGKNHLA